MLLKIPVLLKSPMLLIPVVMVCPATSKVSPSTVTPELLKLPILQKLPTLLIPLNVDVLALFNVPEFISADTILPELLTVPMLLNPVGAEIFNDAWVNRISEVFPIPINIFDVLVSIPSPNTES
jgi:hypothetical protein